MIDVSRKSIVVTGGASGIGLSTVRMLSSVGAHVIIADTNKKLGHDLSEKFKSLSIDCTLN